MISAKNTSLIAVAQGGSYHFDYDTKTIRTSTNQVPCQPIRNEEQVLERELKGYTEYKQRVRYKVIPFIW